MFEKTAFMAIQDFFQPLVIRPGKVKGLFADLAGELFEWSIIPIRGTRGNLHTRLPFASRLAASPHVL